MNSLSQAINPCPSILGHHAMLCSGKHPINVPDFLHAVIVYRSNPAWPVRRGNHVANLDVLDRLNAIGHLHLSQ